MKILLLGGSGILSTDFTRKALNEGNEVYILNRGRRENFIDNRARLIKADIRSESEEKIKSKLQDHIFDVIVDYLSFEPSHLAKNFNIFKNRFEQYIFISSATVYIKTDNDMILEDNNRIGNLNWLYSYNKALCEKYLEEIEVNYTIIRPYVTYGDFRIPFQLIPDGYHYTLFERIKNDKPVALLDGGKAICTLTSTIDFANVLYGLLMNPKGYKQAFHITSQYRQSWKEVYESYCEMLGKSPRLVSVSLNDIKRYMPEYYQSLKGDKGNTWKFDNSKVLDAIGGYDFQIDLKTGLRRSVEYFERHEEMQGIDYKWEGEMDYMIKHVAGIKKLRSIQSHSPNSTKKLYYILMVNPITHGLYIALWRLKHKNG